MSLKPTRRRNGQMHAAVSHRFYPGREFVVSVIASQFWKPVDQRLYDKAAALPTKKAVEKAVRDQYEHYGLSAEMSVMDDVDENVQPDDQDEALEWAEEQMARLWPEWSK